MSKEGKKNILIVDEEATYRELLRAALQENYCVIDTGDCDEASALVALNPPNLIIIDAEMTDQKGFELCEQFKEEEKSRDIPILFLISVSNKEDIIRGLRVGASDYLTKPLCLTEISARIESHLRTDEDYSELERSDLLLLLELSEAISVTRNPTAILRLIVNKVSKILNVSRCSVISLSEGKKVIVKASSDLEKNREILLDINRYPEIRKSIETKTSVVVNDIKNAPLMVSVRDHIEALEYNSVIVIPLIKKESVIGTFFLRTVSTDKGGVSNRVYKLCELVSSIAANALENAMLFESVKSAQEYFEEMAIRDELTKIYNRRHFYDRLNEEFSKTERFGSPLSLIFFDVDDFKRINDTYGHAQGDRVLMQIGRLLKNCARSSDLPARFGGDEFAMILPNTPAKGAMEVAERLCSIFKRLSIEDLEGETISSSIGVASCVSGELQSVDELVKLADDAMYASKTQGKGGVSLAR